MPAFRTPIAPLTPPFSIGYEDEVLTLGSCFAESIGERLRRHKFRTTVNPFGVLYNPVSVAHSLALLLGQDSFEPDLVFENQGLWHHFDFHGRYSRPEPEAARKEMLRSLEEGRAALGRCTCLMITLGTAFVHVHSDQGRVVANCHRVPAARFQRRRLEVEEAFSALAVPLRVLLEERPALKIVLSVSPVRHLRDGFVENQRSKATLLLLADRLDAAFPGLIYYPAYELLLDDLRDYRFYGEDRVHPSSEAVDYIWQHFLDSFLPPEDMPLFRKVQQLLQAVAHRPFHPQTPQHQAFVRRQLAEVEALASEWPRLDWSEERRRLSQQLIG